MTIQETTARLQNASNELEAANAAYNTAYARLDALVALIDQGIDVEDECYAKAYEAQFEALNRWRAADSLYREAKRLHYIAKQEAKAA